MTPSGTIFVCYACHRRFSDHQANLDADNNLICIACYLADPPPEDVDGHCQLEQPRNSLARGEAVGLEWRYAAVAIRHAAKDRDLKNR